MFSNYLYTALRNLLNNKVFSLLNIAGLAIGIACTILIYLWVQDERSYDQFHANGDRVYRVVQDITFTDKTTWAITQGPLGASLTKDFPEITGFCRVFWANWQIIKDENKIDLGGLYVDSSFFDYFSFPLEQGDPSTVLTDPRSIVLTHSTAEKLFGQSDPLDQTVSLSRDFEFRVSGVVADPPGNTIMSFNYLLPEPFADEVGYNVEIWNNSSYFTFVMLDEGIDHEGIAEKIKDYLVEKPTIEEDASLWLQPLSDIYLHSTGFDFDLKMGDIRYVYIFSVIAAFILIIACLNFMNISTARSVQRAKEIGIRKVAGASRGRLISQLFSETILQTLLATIIAFILVELIRPLFNTLSGKELDIAYRNPELLLSILMIMVISGLLSGLYPAVYMSSFRPASVLKGEFLRGGSRHFFRRVLVVFQFAISICLIIATIVADRQFHYMRNKNLGFDRENLVSLPYWIGFKDHYETIIEKLQVHPDITSVTSMGSPLSYGYRYSNSLWSWEGKGDDEEILIRATWVGYEYFETLEMEMVAGRSFSKDFSSDTVNSIIINETAARIMGFIDPVGKRIMEQDFEYTVIGVVKDYHFRSLHQDLDPLVIRLIPDLANYLALRIKPSGEGDVTAALDHIETVWNEYVKDSDFYYQFFDDIVDSMYASENKIRQIINVFSLLAIIISCLGLFGLALFMTESRTKEIGIRKVNGASALNTTLLLSRDFTKWVLLAMAIAFILAYFGLDRWLNNYPFRIELSWWIFALAGLLALLISWLTVIYQAVSTANKNPVNSLRYE